MTRLDLQARYEYMRCGNVLEFKQRLQWLSEGMLKNHMTGVVLYTIDQEEIKLYQEYCQKRNMLTSKK